jgi:anti-sigma regulatory factor (Ser/Thr protein kinase)
MRELEIELRADEMAPRVSRARLGEIETFLGPRSPDVSLVVSELVTNAVRHAASTQKVRVRVKTDNEKIRLEVVDSGPGFAPTMSRGDGMGLTIIERLADDWGVKVDGECTVWVELSKSVGADTSG